MPSEPKAAELGEAHDALSVRERILATAARLFAEKGLDVGLRRITAEAGASLAAVNYHFRSKEGLLEELFEQFSRPMAEERLRRLALCRAAPDRPPMLEQLLEAFLRPGFTLGIEPRLGGAAFVKLRARLAVETEDLARRIFAHAFDDSSRQFLDAIAATLPHIPRTDIEWRFHFLLGAQFYTMANSGRIQTLTGGSCDPGQVELALHHLIPFIAAGFRSAPVAHPCVVPLPPRKD
jgi:AcrR family transcriptional regulator